MNSSALFILLSALLCFWPNPAIPGEPDPKTGTSNTVQARSLSVGDFSISTLSHGTPAHSVPPGALPVYEQSLIGVEVRKPLRTLPVSEPSPNP